MDEIRKTGTGNQDHVVGRIATPMVGGLVTSFMLELLVYPAVYKIWKRRTEMRGMPFA